MKEYARAMGWDFEDLVRNGIPIATLEAAGDIQLQPLIDQAKSRLGGAGNGQ
jgi:hypothetical protein